MASSQQPTVKQPPARTVGQRYQPLALVVGATLCVLGGMGSRLAYLQILQGNQNRELAAANRVQLMPLASARGRLWDARGRLLVDSRPAYSVFICPVTRDRRSWPPVIDQLAMALGVSAAEIRGRIERVGYRSPQWVRVASQLPPERLTAIAELSHSIGGIQIEAETGREYPYGPVALTVLGTVSERTTADLGTRLPPPTPALDSPGPPAFDDFGELVGRSGLEAALDDRLRGAAGARRVEIDGQGQQLRVLAERPAVPGEDLTLTLDVELQQAAEVALGEYVGTLVALDPHSGGVLAMANSGGRDGLSAAGGDHRSPPLTNAALKATVPGPWMRLVVALAGLESKRYGVHERLWISPLQRTGGIAYDRFITTSSLRGATLGFAEALAAPADAASEAFFERVARDVGVAEVLRWGRRLGLGQQTGIELVTEEEAGTSLETLWTQESWQGRWYVGEGMNAVMGRGGLTATPLQMAVVMAAVANGGYRVLPHLLQGQGSRNGREFLGFDLKKLDHVRAGLQRTMTGQGDREMVPLVPMAAIGGVARVSGDRTLAWYGGFAPPDNPQVVVVGWVEGRGQQGLEAAERAVRLTAASHLSAARGSLSRGQNSPLD
ncbi:MAG: penicillin-binding protein 2 [Cyanophyceae cyanobacterium]